MRSRPSPSPTPLRRQGGLDFNQVQMTGWFGPNIAPKRCEIKAITDLAAAPVTATRIGVVFMISMLRQRMSNPFLRLTIFIFRASRQVLRGGFAGQNYDITRTWQQFWRRLFQPKWYEIVFG